VKCKLGLKSSVKDITKTGNDIMGQIAKGFKIDTEVSLVSNVSKPILEHLAESQEIGEELPMML